MSLETINFDHFPLATGQTVLDIGCGEGRHTITAYLKGEVMAVGLDLSLKDLETARSRGEQFKATVDNKGADPRSMHFLRGSALSLPFEDASVERVICSEVLEHIPDYQQVLSEITRILIPGGLFAVSVPRFGPEWICWQLSRPYHEVEGGHIRIFNARKLRHNIEEKGLFFYKRHWAHALHAPYWWLKCLFWSSADDSKLVRWYHRFLVWDLMQKPTSTHLLEQALNPLFGKSVVMYFIKGTV